MGQHTSRRATPVETIRIGALLEEHFDREAGAYREGWDDKRIVAVVSGELSDKTAAHIRKSLGMLMKAVGGFSAQSAAIEELKAAHVKLAFKLAKLDFLLDKLGRAAALKAGNMQFDAMLELANQKFRESAP